MPKTVRRLGLLTSLRGMTPTSPDLAQKFMNFRFNHLRQLSVKPPTLGGRQGNWTTPNASGGPTVSVNAQTGQVLGRGGMPWTDRGYVHGEGEE